MGTRHHAGVDEGRLHRAVGARRRHDGQAVLGRAEATDQIEVGHSGDLRLEAHGDARRAPEGEALDDRLGRVGIEAKARKPVEDRAEADAQLEPRKVHPEALVRPGAEREVVLPRPAESPLVGVVERVSSWFAER